MELTIGNDLADVAILRDAVDRFAEEHGIAPKPLIALQVSLDELISNIIKYAWPDGGTHQLQIRLRIDSAVIEAEISDDGQPYDPRNSPPPPAVPAGTRPRPGGVGVHMVKQLADRLEYERVGDRNRLKLTIRRASDTRAQSESPDDRRT